MSFDVITVRGIQPFEIDGLFVKGFAHADFTCFKAVDGYGGRQVYTVRQPLCRTLFFRRGRFGNDGNVAGGYFGNVQAAAYQLGRFPIESETADGDVGTFGFYRPVVAVKSGYQRTFEVLGRDVYAEP